MEAEIHGPRGGVDARRGSYVFAWVLLVFALGLAVAGAVLGWAERWIWYDEAIHAFSLFAMTLVAGLHLYGKALTGYAGHKLLLVFTVTCVAVTVGVAWEWAELAYDRLTGAESVIKGKFDTLLDLVMDGIGGLVAGVVLLALLRQRTPSRDGAATTAG